MKRADAISWMWVAGYHDDKAAFTRLFIENRVSKKVADEAFFVGRAQRAAGMKCMCYECKEREHGA